MSELNKYNIFNVLLLRDIGYGKFIKEVEKIEENSRWDKIIRKEDLEGTLLETLALTKTKLSSNRDFPLLLPPKIISQKGQKGVYSIITDKFFCEKEQDRILEFSKSLAKDTESIYERYNEDNINLSCLVQNKYFSLIIKYDFIENTQFSLNIDLKDEDTKDSLDNNIKNKIISRINYKRDLYLNNLTRKANKESVGDLTEKDKHIICRIIKDLRKQENKHLESRKEDIKLQVTAYERLLKMGKRHNFITLTNYNNKGEIGEIEKK